MRATWECFSVGIAAYIDNGWLKMDQKELAQRNHPDTELAVQKAYRYMSERFKDFLATCPYEYSCINNTQCPFLLKNFFPCL